MLTPSQWAVARELTFYLLRCLDRGRDAAPASFSNPPSWQDLGGYLRAVDFEEDLDDALRFTYGSAQSLGDDLASAHRAAAGIQVAAPDDVTISRLSEDLNLIDTAIRHDQNFKLVSNVAGALAKAMS